MNKLVLLYMTTLFSLAFVSCKKNNLETTSEPKELINEQYGTDVHQKFDLYLPANRNTDTKVILFLHGGGFVAGDKSDFTNQCRALSLKGFAVVNANYRLVDTLGLLANPPVHRPSDITINHQLADVKSLIDMIRANASSWNVSQEKIATAGHSAGATLALLAAYNNKDKIKAVANWAGATDLSFPDESYVNTIPAFLAEAYYRIVGYEMKNENKLAFMAVSPIWVALTGKHTATINIRPEFNVVFGMPDESKQAYQDFTNVLVSKGAINKLVEIKAADHGFGQPGNWQEVINLTADFFNEHVK